MRKILLILMLCISVGMYADKISEYYTTAKTEMSQGKYEQALFHLNKLVEKNNNSANYRDVEQMLKECKKKIALENKYQAAKQQMNQKKYALALNQFKAINAENKGNYRDVSMLIKQCETKIKDAELAAAKRKQQQENLANAAQETTTSAPVKSVSETQPQVSVPQSSYAGLYNDYFSSKSGDWRIQWFTIDFHGMTTVGDNISLLDFRWKPVEASLININLDYVHGPGFSINWEPIVRGYLPVSHDGRWSVYAGMGAHVSLYGGQHSFLAEIGAEANWNEKYSSRMFFKYNGGFALGMSFSIGKWL